jgi:hypothetical protein
VDSQAARLLHSDFHHGAGGTVQLAHADPLLSGIAESGDIFAGVFPSWWLP